MTEQAARLRSLARELSIVFVVVLVAALIAVRVRSSVLGTPDTGGSQLITAVAATLVFWAVSAAGRRALAWGMTALLLVALTVSAVTPMAIKQLDPVRSLGTLPRVPREIAPLPAGLVRIGDFMSLKAPKWVVRDPAVELGPEGGIRIHGTPQASYSYLLVSKADTFARGAHIVFEGVITSGGVSIGLHKNGFWAAYTTVDRVGAFRSWVIVPADDDYQFVVAYGVVANTPTHIELSPLTLWQ